MILANNTQQHKEECPKKRRGEKNKMDMQKRKKTERFRA
jgi:hypothetical protein